MPRRFVTRFELALFLLALVTAAAVLGRHRLLGRTLVVEPDSRYTVEIKGDAANAGGSVARWTDRAGQRFECDLRPGFAYPFCLYQVNTGDLDMRAFTHLDVWIRYEGEAKTVRVVLRNRSPAYSRAGDPGTFKFNQVEVHASALQRPVRIALSDFQVASWWLLERDVPLEHSRPDISHVASIEVHTGTGARLGRHRFEILRIELSGQWISTERFYLGLIVLWLLAIMTQLAHKLVGLRSELERRRRRERELVELNRLLDIESREFEAAAKTDALTGALNRAGIRDLLRASAVNWQQHGRPLSVILMDLDDFKGVNDSCGHDAGDRALVAFVGLVRGRVRSSDALARWGGDEFVLVCPDTILQDAANLARGLREALETVRLVEGRRVSASFGVASLGRETVSELFRRADASLYEAKWSGRNRVVVADTAPAVAAAS